MGVLRSYDHFGEYLVPVEAYSLMILMEGHVCTGFGHLMLFSKSCTGEHDRTSDT